MTLVLCSHVFGMSAVSRKRRFSFVIIRCNCRDRGQPVVGMEVAVDSSTNLLTSGIRLPPRTTDRMGLGRFNGVPAGSYFVNYTPARTTVTKLKSQPIPQTSSAA